jgi:hypothetical protein
VAARATAEELVAGRLWQVDGGGSAGVGLRLPRRAAAPGGHRCLRPGHAAAGLGPAGAQPQPPVSPGRAGMGDLGAWTARPSSPARSVAPPVDPHRLPGPRLGELDPADVAKLWRLLSELRGGQLLAHGQLIRLTGVLPADLAAWLLRLLDGGPELVGAQAARIGTAIDPDDPATPALGVIVLGWLEAAAQVLAAGSSSQELQVLLSVADRHGQAPSPTAAAGRRSTTGCSPAQALYPT